MTAHVPAQPCRGLSCRRKEYEVSEQKDGKSAEVARLAYSSLQRSPIYRQPYSTVEVSRPMNTLKFDLALAKPLAPTQVTVTLAIL